MTTDTRAAEPTAPAVPAPSKGPGVVVIRPQPGWIAVDWSELFRHRELLYFLVLRDVKVRYKQTVLGVAWAVLQPLLTTIIYTVVFGVLAKMNSDGLPYAVFAFAGQWAWTFFAGAVGNAGTSLVSQQHLLTKIYLPRLLVPAASVVGSLVDMAIASLVMAALLVYYGISPWWGIVAVPILVLLLTAVATGAGLALASMTVTYRDFRHLIPFMLQCWMFLSPVVYPVTIVPERWRWVMMLNPLTGIIEGFRSALLGRPWQWASLSVSAAISVGALLFGIYFFRRAERRFADVV